MADYTWLRNTFQGSGQTGSLLLARLLPGQTLVRVRFGWNAGGAVSSYTDLFSVHGEQVIFALETVIGDGTETPTFPVDDPNYHPSDAERYLWWEGRAMMVDAFSQSASGTQSYTSKPQQEPADAKAQVRAPEMDPGDALDVWAVWETDISWPFGVDPYVTGWANALILSP